MVFEFDDQLVQLSLRDIIPFDFPEPQKALVKLNRILKQVQCKAHQLQRKKICDIKQNEFKHLEWAHVCVRCDAIFLRRAE